MRSALAQFVKPITTPAAHGSSIRDRPRREERHSSKQEFERFQPPPEQNAKVIPFVKPKEPEKESSEAPRPPPTQSPPARSTSSQSPSQSFLQLIELLRQGQTNLFRWFGINAYRAALNGQKKLSKFRKGSMLDQKAE